jgi:hypothetical protein
METGDQRDGRGHRIATLARRAELVAHRYLKDVLSRLPAMTNRDDLSLRTSALARRFEQTPVTSIAGIFPEPLVSL